MKKILAQLFSDSGSISAMRVMSIICCLAAILIAIVGLHKDAPDYGGLSTLCGTFLGAAFGGKVVQKQIESKAS